MSEHPIDFSPLNPARDGARWDGLVRGLASRAHAARRRRFTVVGQLLAWSRPALGAAACVALLGAFGIAFGGAGGAAPTSASPALSLAGWAARAEKPDPGVILTVLGGSDGSD